MIVTRLSVIAIAILCMIPFAEAKRHPRTTGPERFLCDNFEVGCPRKPARAKLKKKNPKIVKAAPETVAKQAPEAPKPAPIKPVPKPGAAAEPKPIEPEQKQATILPIKPVEKPDAIMPPPSEGPPPADEAAACRADLSRLGAEFDVPQNFEAGQGCSVANPVQLKSLRTTLGTISLPGRPTLKCTFAKQFVIWLGDVAAPVVAAHEDSSFTALSTGTSFQCRGRNGEASAKMSEHAFGNAIDIDGVLVAGRKRIDVAAVSDPANPAYRMLMALRISACGYFTTVLGPGANAAHASHYHFDLGLHGKSGNYRICE